MTGGYVPYPQRPANYDTESIFGLGAPGEVGLYGQGYNRLVDLLNNPGQTDQARYQQALRSNRATTANQLASTQGMLQKRGTQNGRLATALRSSITDAGTNRQAMFSAQNARRGEGLRRTDTQDFLGGFVQKPRLDRYAADKGVSLAQSQARKQKTASYAATAAALIGTIAAAACRVAKELYGEDSEKFHDARAFVITKVPASTSLKYIAHGEELAAAVRNDPDFRARVEPIFERLAERGAKMRESHA